MSDVPMWHEFMAPTLRVLSDGRLRSARETRDEAARVLGVTDEAKLEVIPSGQLRWENRALWALSYLARAGALDRPTRGHYRITGEGQQLLAEHPSGIAQSALKAWTDRHGVTLVSTSAANAVSAETPPDLAMLSPLEQVEDGISSLHSAVASELLSRLHSQRPEFFERAVLDLLMAMGYGGTQGRATPTQLSRDGGIDGVIDQDALGLSRVYVQAKLYDPKSTIGRPAIQGFVGALHGQQANQGVFITTARYSREAINYAANVSTRVVLIDGERLASLMIKYRVGVQVRQRYELVDLDEDFFE